MTQVSNIRSVRPVALVQPDERREYEPTYTLDRQVEQARRSMGRDRWEALNSEWPA